jgi:Flp pilus assembly pilin Flp
MSHLLKKFIKNESGQGITEYGAVLAFVAFLIAGILATGQGTLGSAVKNAFSATANSLTQLVSNVS